MNSIDVQTLNGVGDVTPDWLLRVIADARYWWERVDPVAEAPGTAVMSLPEDAFIRWREVVAKGNPVVFAHYLGWVGIDPVLSSQAPHVAAGAVVATPRWSRTAARYVAAAQSFGTRKESRAFTEANEPLPFEHILLPAVLVAHDLLRERTRNTGAAHADSIALVSPHAHAALERALLRRLCALAARTFYAEFEIGRPFGDTVLGLLDIETFDQPPTEVRYQCFVERITQSELPAFFGRYPVLARLLATAIDQWVDATEEFLVRLADDRDRIAALLGPPDDGPGGATGSRTSVGTPLVTAIDVSLSDAHKGGRTVSILTLADGRRLVYKPKSLALEDALGRFVAWCNAAGVSPPMRAIRVIDRGKYGWAEYVEHVPCADAEAAGRFYRRAGMLLCLLHVLRATDCHHGNVIACGEHPFLVDAETLLHPEARPIDDGDPASAPDPITRRFIGSVLRPLFLPVWHISGDGTVAYNVSALGGSGGDSVTYRVADWRETNTDRMVLTERVGATPVERNIPRVGDRPLCPDDFVAELESGFEKMYRTLEARRDELLSPAGPLETMRGLPLRFVFRDTRIYLTVLTNACAPEFLRDGNRFGIELDHMAQAFLACRTKPAVWPLLRAELEALGRLDVPYFSAHTDSDTLTATDGRELPGYFVQAGLQDACERVADLGEDDLHWQLALIRGSFEARVARNAGSGATLGRLPPAPIPSADVMIGEAERIAGELERRAIIDGTGEVNWLGLSLAAETGRVHLTLLTDSMYQGRSGVALFLAALHHVTGRARLRDLARGALVSLHRNVAWRRAAIEDPHMRRAAQPNPADAGWSIWALVRIGALLDDPEPLALANSIAAMLNQDVAAADRSLDVLAGSAGAVLGLLVLYRATGDAAVLQRALLFGDHLLANRVSVAAMQCAWRTMGERPLTGFSHGAAGIAYALAALYRESSEERFLAAAREAVNFESALFDADRGNWPDLRSNGNDSAPAFPNQWCHGAAGIGLARLATRDAVPDWDLGADIEAAIGTTVRLGLTEVDHLCCGNMGRIEAIWIAAQRLQRADWHDAALLQAAEVLQRARRAEIYQVFPNLPCHVFNPSLYRGVAGIGYQWLRLAYPNLPSAMLSV